MLVFIYAQVLTQSNSIPTEHPWVTELRNQPDWVTMDLDSFSAQPTVNLALRLLEQAERGLVCIDIKSKDGSAIPFAPLMETSLKDGSQINILKTGVEHYLVEKVWATLPDDHKRANLTDEDWKALVLELTEV
jgi:hypothetical protein